MSKMYENSSKFNKNCQFLDGKKDLNSDKTPKKQRSVDESSSKKLELDLDKLLLEKIAQIQKLQGKNLQLEIEKSLLELSNYSYENTLKDKCKIIENLGRELEEKESKISDLEEYINLLKSARANNLIHQIKDMIDEYLSVD